MHRTTKTLHRPEPHLFCEDRDIPADHRGRRFCRCALREDDELHVAADRLYEPSPPEADHIDHRRIGESE